MKLCCPTELKRIHNKEFTFFSICGVFEALKIFVKVCMSH